MEDVDHHLCACLLVTAGTVCLLRGVEPSTVEAGCLREAALHLRDTGIADDPFEDPYGAFPSLRIAGRIVGLSDRQIDDLPASMRSRHATLRRHLTEASTRDGVRMALKEFVAVIRARESVPA